jgi:dimethylaniline monooxygenase (N-oxide forming)
VTFICVLYILRTQISQSICDFTHHSTFFIRCAFFFGSGTSGGFNQWIGCKENVQRGHYFINKGAHAQAYLNRAHLQSWWQAPFRRLWNEDAPALRTQQPIDASSLSSSSSTSSSLSSSPKVMSATTEPTVCVHSRIARVDGSTVEFEDGSVVADVDVIVFATGYAVTFPFLDAQTCAFIGDGDWHTDLLRHVAPADDASLFFVGFVRPNVGAIPPMSELQTQWWVHHIRGHVTAASLRAERRFDAHYDVLCPRAYAKNGVDYGMYMNTIARDMGAQPSLFWLLTHSPRAFLLFTLGQSFPTLYRLQGPFVSADALRICEGELYETITSRGIGGNLIFVFITILFGAINAAFAIADCALWFGLGCDWLRGHGPRDSSTADSSGRAADKGSQKTVAD